MHTNEAVSGLTVGSFVYPVKDWLNDGFSNSTTGGNCTSGYLWVQPDPWRWPIREVEYRTVKVRMKLSEVEELREAVKGNKAARAALNKLAHLIEIEGGLLMWREPTMKAPSRGWRKVPLSWKGAMRMARRVFRGTTAAASGHVLAYVLWNESAWPFNADDRHALQTQLVAARNSEERP